MRRLALTRLARGVTEAAATLLRNPLRSALSGLAMAAAVATTAIVQTSLDGLALSARQTSARAFGSDAFVITRVAAGSVSRRVLADKLARNAAITRSDVRFLESVASDRVNYAATALSTADVSSGSRTFENATMGGTQASLPAVRDIALERGRFISADEDVRGSQVTVLGREVADALFPDIDPIGQTVRVARRAFLVIGVQVVQGSSGGQSLDRYVWMPLTAFDRAFGTPQSLQVFAAAPPGVPTRTAEDHARISMRARRHLAPAAADSFDIVTPEASRTFVERITAQVGAAGPPIALIALIAAIVVVTNTTLVSVAERTREIGLRRAVGAPRSSILLETMAESFIVGIAGGITGLLLAAAALGVLDGVLALPLHLNWPVVLMSLLSAAASGLVAGWYPARRAVDLDVVDALRQES
jgi:putative ABC transport system permease protein